MTGVGVWRAAGVARSQQACHRGSEWNLLWRWIEWALSADMILVAEHATFALPKSIREHRGCRHFEITQAHPLAHCHGVAFYRQVDGCRRSASLGTLNEVTPLDKLLVRAHELAAMLAEAASCLCGNQGGLTSV